MNRKQLHRKRNMKHSLELSLEDPRMVLRILVNNIRYEEKLKEHRKS